jgi:hypothetical protein
VRNGGRRSTAVARMPVLFVLALASFTVAASLPTAALSSTPRAQSARTVNGADTAHLRLVHQREEVLEEEGVATGALPGRMRAELDVQARSLSGRCTIYTSGGSITGEGHATPQGSGRFQSFHGTLLITKGTGRYRDIRGRAGLYGTFDRRTYALVVQTTGTLSY